jgi:hypothetical protein
MSDSPRSDYAKFNGINFPQWKFGVMLKLRRKKLDSIVLGTETKPIEVKMINTAVTLIRRFCDVLTVMSKPQVTH